MLLYHVHGRVTGFYDFPTGTGPGTVSCWTPMDSIGGFMNRGIYCLGMPRIMHPGQDRLGFNVLNPPCVKV